MSPPTKSEQEYAGLLAYGIQVVYFAHGNYGIKPIKEGLRNETSDHSDTKHLNLDHKSLGTY
jgi:hypothetical protein